MSPVVVLICILVSAVYGNSSSACFDGIGCFDTGTPWSSLLRPVPPPQGPLENPAKVYFFTRKNPTSPCNITTYPDIIIEGATEFDGERPTVIIIHGHIESTEFQWMHTLKDVYLKRFDANVFLLDWGKGAGKFYPQSVSNTRVIARLTSRLLTFLINNYGLIPSAIHLIGHSLGANIASYIAKETPGIGRFTALDPAQPLYEGYGKMINLDKSDAAFVEVVHTNALPIIPFFGRGSIRPYGHVDFYFNGGGLQPMCLIPTNLPNITNPINLLLHKSRYENSIGLCSHQKSRDYLIEAYNDTNDCVFWGHRSSDESSFYGFWNILKGYIPHYSAPCGVDECIPFGFDTIHSELRGVFHITTNFLPPYCKPEKLVASFTSERAIN